MIPIKKPKPLIRPVPIRDPGPGCVLYLAHDSPGSGGMWVDRSGQGNHGTIIGATHTDTPWGRGLLLDGVDDYVSPPAVTYGPDTTISAWIRGSSYSATGAILSYYSSARIGLSIGPSGSKGDARFGFSPNNWGANRLYLSSGSDLLDIDRWYSITAVLNGSAETGFLYLNDKDVTTVLDQAGSINGSMTKPADIGRYTTGNNYFNGSIALIRIYNRALSAAEIAQHYWEETPYA